MSLQQGGWSSWEASLELGFEQRAGRTVLKHRRQRGPLAVQRTFHPEGDTCHLYLLHPPGGVAGGDRLAIEIGMSPGASALVTTPGATKFYNSIGPTAQQVQHFSVHQGCLEWLPQENIFFPDAAVELKTEIDLDGDARYIGWEFNCLGRPVIGERFDQGHVLFSTRLRRDGRPLLIDRLAVDSSSLSGLATLRDRPVIATMVATGADREVIDKAREITSETAETGVTLLGDVLVCRYLGDSTEQARKLFVAVWQAIRPMLIGKEAVLPRIWAT
ncbi:MAG: urease accessory protein UreD [Sedimenticolaceae bacterium]|nr:urease accessory protein UreD [Sedimenticolaceae bacterium]